VKGGKTTTAKRAVEAAAFVAVLGLGWKWPVLAYCLFLNVAVGIAGAIRHGGRHGCGTFCPRGAFYSFLPDTGRKVPRGLLGKRTSLFVMAALLAGLWAGLRPGTWREWGLLFYWMIVVTTSVGLVGWLAFNRWFWCSVCPMGKIYKLIRPGRTVVAVGESCVGCGLCAKACPFGFNPPKEAEGGMFRDPDCLHCGRCAERCPKGALELRRG
jgi:NAD-dependent dihydropyrimidine dehydrogenase PreA subunit